MTPTGPITISVDLAVAPASAYAVFTAHFADWWPAGTHSLSRDVATRCCFEARVGGAVEEQAPDGTRQVWGEVLAGEPGRRVRFSWHPGREPASAQWVEVVFLPVAGGSWVTLTHGGWEALGEVGPLMRQEYLPQDDWIVIDGDAGVAVVNPSPIVLEEYRFRQRQSELERARLDRLRHTPAVTLDGESVELLANIELPRDAPAALAAGAVGVGLFRTEYLFMNRAEGIPGEDEQFEAYRDAVVSMRGLPVTIRTIDIGADKPMDRSGSQDHRHDHQINPALGLRAIRWSLSEPGMFRQQLRAILRAAAYGKVRILIPMLAHLGEIRRTVTCRPASASASAQAASTMPEPTTIAEEGLIGPP